MAYIGNTVQNQGFAPAIDYFNGNGVTVTFTLSRPVASVAQLIVAIDNVIQNPSSSFTVAGNAITFTSAPLSGTNNIWVEYTSLITTYQGISQDPTVIGDIRATGGYLAEGDFGNSFVDGAILDYVTGAGRVTVGELDDITFYHGGTSARSEMMRLSYAGNSTLAGGLAATGNITTTGSVGVGTTSPTFKTEIVGGATTVETTLLQVRSNAGGINTGTTIALGNSTNPTAGSGRVELAALRSTSSGGSFVIRTGDDSGNIQERMRIDSSGRVTQPFQPGFRVYHSGNINYNSGALTPIVYNTSVFNTGSNYNTSTGVFTAPVAGQYLFTVFDMFMGEPTYTFIYLAIQINGGTTTEFMRQGTKSDFDTFGGTLITALAANDQVRVVCGLNGVDAGYLRGGIEMNSFMGYLLG